MRHTETARPLARHRHEAQGGEPVDAQAEDDEGRERVHAGDELVGRGPAEVDEVLDRGSGAGQPIHLEVGAARVVQDEQAVGERVDVVDDLVPPGQDAARRLPRVGRIDEPHLGGCLGGRAQNDPPIVGRGPHAEEEALVRLGEDQLVGLDRRAHLVPPDLVTAPGVVQPRVEDVAVVQRPGQRVADPPDGGIEDRAGIDLPHDQVVALVPFTIGRPGEQSPVRAHLARTDGEEVGVAGLDVLIEKDLLVCRGRLAIKDGTVRRVTDRDPGVDGILGALDGAAVVPPPAMADSHRQVGLHRPRLQLADDPLHERVQVAGALRGIRVLGFEVRAQPGIVAVGHPRVVVEDRMPVHDARLRLAGGTGRLHPVTLVSVGQGEPRRVCRVNTTHPPRLFPLHRTDPRVVSPRQANRRNGEEAPLNHGKQVNPRKPPGSYLPEGIIP